MPNDQGNPRAPRRGKRCAAPDHSCDRPGAAQSSPRRDRGSGSSLVIGAWSLVIGHLLVIGIWGLVIRKEGPSPQPARGQSPIPLASPLSTRERGGATRALSP